MKKKLALIMAIVMILVSLTACGSSTTEENASEVDLTIADTGTQFILGTLLLDGTENEVTIEQAASLLPLWQLYSTISTSDTAAQEEIDALVTQIQNTMTSAQITAIGKIDLAGQNAMQLMNESGLMENLGFDPAENGTSAAGLPDGFERPQGDIGTGGLGRQSGGFSEGARPGGGLGGGTGQDITGMDPNAFATQRAEAGRTGSAGRSSQIYLQLLLSYLNEKVAD